MIPTPRHCTGCGERISLERRNRHPSAVTCGAVPCLVEMEKQIRVRYREARRLSRKLGEQSITTPADARLFERRDLRLLDLYEGKRPTWFSRLWYRLRSVIG